MTEQGPVSRLRRLSPAIVVVIGILASVAVVPAATARAGEEVFASVGTGELNGIYYPVGRAICQIVNRDLSIHGVRCSPETTPGSVYNMRAIQSGELECGIVQSDVNFDAYKGQGAWVGRPFVDLRSVLSLYPELVTVMALAASHIDELAALKGRRVNVGSRGTCTRATWDAIEAELGWRDEERVRPVEMRADATTAALCSGKIDASMLIVGHPSPLVKAQQSARAISLVAITGPVIDKLLRTHLYYQRETTPADLYGMRADVPTFGGRATVVTSAAVDARVVAVVAKAMLDHLAELRSLHPALARLRPREMVVDGLTAPLRPGAEQVFKELGLIE
jgi:TRAP transporter TAXI family solute receptor